MFFRKYNLLFYPLLWNRVHRMALKNTRDASVYL